MFHRTMHINSNVLFVNNVRRGYMTLCRVNTSHFQSISQRPDVSQSNRMQIVKNKQIVYPTHFVQKVYNSTEQDDKKNVNATIFNITFVYCFQMIYALLKDRHVLSKGGIGGNSFLKGLKSAFVAVNDMVAEQNFEHLENVLTEECFQSVKGGNEIKSETFTDLIPIDESDIVAFSLTGVQLRRDHQTNLRHLEVLVRFTYKKGYMELVKRKERLTLKSNVMFSHYKFTRQYGDNEDDKTDWLVKSIYYYTHNERFPFPPNK